MTRWVHEFGDMWSLVKAFNTESFLIDKIA